MAAAATLRSARVWLQGSRRNLLLAAVALGLLYFAAWEAWKQYGASHAHAERYLVDIERMQVTPPPPWVRSQVKSEASRLGSLENLSILDVDTTKRVALAFELHPWVSQVQRVAKHYPASITVDVLYRKPVAVVEVEHAGQAGLLAIDRDGILLPPEDFSAAQVKALPRIAVGKTFPAGPVGSPWGDPRVGAAARIAETLCDDWSGTTLFRITALPVIAGGSPEATAFEIVSREGRQFPWGHAPGREASGEKSATEKKAELFSWLKSAT